MIVLDQVLGFVARRKRRVYLVGGSVRDLLLDRDRYDIDLAVDGDASGMARAFADEIQGAYYVMDDENDVARVVCEFDGMQYYVDFARLRGGSIDDDLATRDFTVNAMALDISDGTLSPTSSVDPFDGQGDLDARRLRAVAGSVFENDPVRLLRAVRFEATLGLALEPRTEEYVRRDARLLVDAAPERAREEFHRILAADSSVRNLRRLDELGLLQFLLPELTQLRGVLQPAPHTYDVYEHSIQAVGAFEEMQKARFLNLAEGAFSGQLELHFGGGQVVDRRRGTLLRLALLLHDAGKLGARTEESDGRLRFLGHEETGAKIAEGAMRRLRFSNDEIDLVSSIIANHLRPIWLAAAGTVSERAVYRFFRATGKSGVDVAVHSWCDQRATFGQTEYSVPEAELQSVIARLLDRFYHQHDRIVDPPHLLDGRDVMKALNLAPGPLVGEMLEALREAEAAGEVTTHEQALDFIRGRYAKAASPETHPI